MSGKMMSKINIFFTVFFVAGFVLQASAQRDTTLTQEVEVVKAYNPTIADANKINDT